MNRDAAFICIIAWCASASAQSTPSQPNSARECATCHLEWVSSFDDPGAVLLIDKPSRPVVASEATCLGCHDGSVGDSRRRVWLEHGHQTGIKPADTMNVPNSLPLTDGALDCRTCHTAHGGPGETLETTIFTRVPNERSQLCMMCHDDANGSNHHPLQKMDKVLPVNARHRWVHDGPAHNEVVCQSCHTPHGAATERLLVTSPKDDALCLRCHEVLMPDSWRNDMTHTHPRNTQIKSTDQLNTIGRWGAHTGEGETLACLSCHDMHKSTGEQNLLYNTLDGSALCLDCHADFDRVFKSSHDLRTSSESEQNALGMTATEGGPCSACHTMHEPARLFDASTHDITASCTSCHEKGECAEGAGGLTHVHPIDAGDTTPQMETMRLFASQGQNETNSIACLTCHDPHETAHGYFLRGKPDQVCASCHQVQGQSLVGAHDFSARSDFTNAVDRRATESGKCGFCHAVHSGSGPAMWAATKSRPTAPEDFCISCHRADGIGGEHNAQTLRHPLAKALSAAAAPQTTAATQSDKVPYFASNCERTADGRMSCASCHDPHANSQASPAMLRTQAGRDAMSLCIECHPNTSAIHDSLHADAYLKSSKGVGSTGGNSSTCGPCHATHANEVVEGMWVGPYDHGANSQASARCLGCHSLDGTATPVDVPVHPPVAMRDFPGTASLPLSSDGVDPGRQIDCTTCHLPHGRQFSGLLDGPTALSDSQRRALKPMLRPYIAPNLCSSCHGFEGIYRFFNYHNGAIAGR